MEHPTVTTRYLAFLLILLALSLPSSVRADDVDAYVKLRNG